MNSLNSTISTFFIIAINILTTTRLCLTDRKFGLVRYCDFILSCHDVLYMEDAWLAMN